MKTLPNARAAKAASRNAVLAALAASFLAASAPAKITVLGTAAEQKKINDAIQRIKDGSPAGKACFEALEAKAQEVKISFGQTDDVATANGDTYEVKLHEGAIDCLMQIDKPGGGGKALDASSLDLIIVHEALGHLHNKLKGGEWGEPEAMAKTNKVRTDLGLPTRTKYIEKDGDKVVIPFSDGSKVDATKALMKKKKANGGAGPEERDYGSVHVQANMPVLAQFNPSSNTWSLFPDPFFPPPLLNIDLAPVGGGLQQPQILDFQMVVAESGDPVVPIEIVSMDLQAAPFDYFGESTGPNHFGLINEGRGGAGDGQLPPLAPDIVLGLGGDYLWQNPLWGFDGFNGLVAGEIMGGMLPTPDPNVFKGQLVLDLIGFPPLPPEPICLADVTTSGTNPGDPGWGQPDGVVNGADLAYYVEQWLAQNAIADMNSTNANPGDPGWGQPDGVINGSDLSYYIEIWLATCG